MRKKRGYSRSIAHNMMTPQSKSTLKVYDEKWNHFCDFCEKKGIDPFYPKLHNVASFLKKKFQEGQGLRSLGVYRAAISATLKYHTKLEVGTNIEITGLMKSFKVQRPPIKKINPEWDLSFILWSLSRRPFEPIQDENAVCLKFLTWKMVFLLMLASGARRSEIHALSIHGTKIAESKEYMMVSPYSGFIAKNTLAKGKPLEPFIIPSLQNHSPDDRSLCPLRCFLEYRRRTEKIRGTKKNLFISYQKGRKTEICRNTISSWIKNLLLHCYKNPQEDAVRLSGLGSHEIRRIASTLVFIGNTCIEDVLQAGSWKVHSTFTDFYLKDLTVLDGSKMRKIGPIVAGQKVILNTKIA